jgi:hypothetical protein
VPPADERPFYTLATSGMSERPMRAPSDGRAYAELVLALPPDWPMEPEAFEDERRYWPFRLLQTLATLPHQFETWLWIGHTVPNGDPPEPYAPDTGLCCAMLGPALTVLALHRDEMEAKLEGGMEALIDPLDQAGVTELLDPARPSVFA